MNIFSRGRLTLQVLVGTLGPVAAFGTALLLAAPLIIVLLFLIEEVLL